MPDRALDFQTNSTELLRRVLDALVDPVFVKDHDSRFVDANAALCRVVGRTREQVVGCGDVDFFPPEQAESFRRGDLQVLSSGQAYEVEEVMTDHTGDLRRLVTRKYPLYDADGAVIGVCGIINDVTVLHRRQARIDRLEAQLDRLAVPVLQIWDGVLLLPLVGVFDEQRAGRVLTEMLEAIVRHRARFVILDLTGVAELDVAVARALVQCARGSDLLGCAALVVGLGPTLAATLIADGIDFGATPTYATLQAGLAEALRRSGLRIGDRAR